MDYGLLGAGLIAALGAASSYATPKRGSAPRRSVGRQGRRVQTRSTGQSGMQPTNRADLAVRAPSITNVPTRVPRNLPGIIAWDSVKITNGLLTSTSGVSEVNFNFQLSQHPQASSWASLFDQYTIVMASVSFQSDLAPGSTTSPPLLYTALDFDNATALGSIAAIEDFSSSQVSTMGHGKAFVRSVMPCAKLATGSATLAVPTRTWVDCSNATVPFYGIRSMGSQTATAVLINTVTTIYYAFRNHI